MSYKKSTGRKTQKEKTKQKLIAAGIELIKNANYDDITVEDITDLSGVSKGTFYVHFESKDQYFYSLCHADYAKLSNILIDGEEPLYLERLRRFCREWISINEIISIYYMRHWFSHIYDTEFHMKVVGAPNPFDTFREDIKTCIKCAKKNNELVTYVPVDDLTDYTLITLYGFDVFRATTERNFEISKWAKFIADSIVDGKIGAYRP